jgi:hypothetical protein
LTQDGSPRAPDSWYDRVKSVDRYGHEEYFFRGAVDWQRTRWGGGDSPDSWRGAAFALEHPDHAWRDYLNCDVPCFYHTLGSPYLLNSKGDQVNVDSAIKWQERNVTSPPPTPGAWQPNDRGAYLPETPIDMVTKQLERLRTACWVPDDQRTLKRVQARKAFLAEAFSGTGLAGDLQLFVSQRQAVGAGAQ